MAELGKTNSLTIVKKTDFGLYLDGKDSGEILLPNRYVTPDMEPGQTIDVFLYLDGEERLTATTETPKAKVGEVAFLKVKSVEKAGAFLEWGIMKDILVPFSEQKVKMEPGKYYIVYLYIDKITDRITATMKLEKFIHKTTPGYSSGQLVSGIVFQVTDLAYKVVINHQHFGLLYKNEVFKPLMIGQSLSLYVKKVRPDDKIDLSADVQGFQKLDAVSQKIWDKLVNEGGFLPFHDKTDAEVIYRNFGISKKVFKASVGTLYKQRKITLLPDGIKVL